MTIWKKAISAATSAALLASLLATAVAPSAFAAPVTVTGSVPYVASNSEVPADGASTIVLTFGANSADATTGTVTITTTNGRFTSDTGALVIGATQTIAVATGPLGTTSLGTLTMTAPIAAGTAIVTVQITPTAGGTARTDSQTTFTFTAATSTAVSTAYSTTVLSASTAPVAAGITTGVTATTTVRDTNNVAIATGAAVTWTLTGPAFFNGLGATSAATATNAAGVAVSPAIFSTGVAGAVTVATSVKYLSVPYALATKTLTLVGAVAKIVASNSSYSIPVNNAGDTGDELFAEVTDAALQSIATGVTFTIGTYFPANIFTVDATTGTYDTTDKGYYLDVDCVATGTATVTLKASTTFGTTTTTVTSDPVTFVCATALSAAKPGTLDVSAGSTTVAPNGTVAITATVKDFNGLPAPDGTIVTAVTNGVGTVFSSAGTGSKGTVNGVAKFTYYAPANAGSGTVTVFTANAVPSSKSVTITITGVVPPPPSVGRHVPAYSALGVTRSGPFSTSTKVAALGHFVTVKMVFGASHAGRHIQIWKQSKNSAGVWSAKAYLTARVADASGNVYFYWRSYSAAWWSIQGRDGTTWTNPVQTRWMR